MSGSVLVHATAVAIAGRAMLLRGPSGVGKSDLALRLIDAGAQLIADDQSELTRRADTVFVRAPAALAGLLEVRGVGIVRFPVLAEAPLTLLVDLVSSEAVERLPEWRSEPVLGCPVPLISIAPFEASAIAKLRLASSLRGASRPPDIRG